MKTFIIFLFVSCSIVPLNVLASDYQMVSDCIADGDTFIKLRKNIEEISPGLRGRLINDSEIAAIREAEAECAKKTPEEKIALKQNWDREFSEKYGIKMPQHPSIETGTGSYDHYFSPGGMFNPIHVKVH